MMSPYEGERIFEAEMVRLHLCDRSLYAHAEGPPATSRSAFSIREWLKERLVSLPIVKKVQPSPISDEL
ncbi:MAG: hypothetical protein NZ553_18715 [Caldilinea sp.]|nr:hypothetical protein [Caldilinea sp.]MDW8442513.1 hypothetical protein [Caldilineaceae bacterium]